MGLWLARFEVAILILVCAGWHKFKCGLPKLPLSPPGLWPYHPDVNPFEQMKRGLAVGLVLAVSGCAASSQSRTVTTPDPWAAQAEILRRIVPPQFPARDFDVTKFDAVADGVTLNTTAFRVAISAASQAGGGRVVVPPGKYLTGPIHMRSGVNLHLAEGAEIIFSDKFEDYLPVVLVRVGGIELYNYSPLIYARDCTNIAVTGKGKLNGNAKRWWDWKTKETKAGFEMGAKGVPVEQRIFGKPEHAIRPSFLSFVGCTNILLEDFTIGSGPNWTIHPIYCQNTTIRGVKVITDGPNNDGVDPDSCLDMLIENCIFDTGDDCVVLKSGYNEDGWRVGRPTENVIMRNCFSKRGHGGLVIGSEMSGGVRNVFMEDCEFEGTDRAIRIKSRADRGGVVENIFARNLKVKNMQREVVILNMDYGSDRQKLTKTTPPVFRNMQFENITGDGAPTAILIQGLADSLIENIRFVNMTIKSTKGVVANFAKGLVFDNVQVTPAGGPVFKLTDAQDITITKSVAPKGTELFLQLGGRTSRAVTLEECDLSGAAKPFVLGADIKPAEVQVK
jgi:polygalacturonase